MVVTSDLLVREYVAGAVQHGNGGPWVGRSLLGRRPQLPPGEDPLQGGLVDQGHPRRRGGLSQPDAAGHDGRRVGQLVRVLAGVMVVGRAPAFCESVWFVA